MGAGRAWKRPVFPASAPVRGGDLKPGAKGPKAIVTKLVPVDSVRPDPKNAREHSERNLETICGMLRTYGQQTPITVDRKGIIRKGNGTWLAAKRLEWTEINVTVTELEGDRAAQYAIGDNRAGDLSYFDDAALAGLIGDMDGGELLVIGFDEAERNEILEAAGDPLEVVKKGKPSQQGNKGQVSVRTLVVVQSAEVFERAMSATGKQNREQALMEVCQSYLRIKEKALADSAGQLE